MTTLADFLLARIAEDEDRARRLQNAYDLDLLRASAGLINAGALVVPARVLAECEVKRRIVAVAVAASAEEQRRRERQLSDETARPVAWALEDVLILLAHPHSEHPDYQDEWLF